MNTLRGELAQRLWAKPLFLDRTGRLTGYPLN